MPLKAITSEEREQIRLLTNLVFEEEVHIRNHTNEDEEGRYRGDLVLAALEKTMETALRVGISIGVNRVR
jgi:hypothetical protein